MFIKKVSCKSDIQTAVNQFIKENCGVNPPFNLDREFCIYIEETSKIKTFSQNNAFHLLLGALWDSGLTSFQDEIKLRNHYKEIAGLMEIKKVFNFSDFTRKCLYKAIKLLPIPQEEKEVVYRFLKCEETDWHSWGDATKEQATKALKTLIDDCVDSNVYNAYSQNKKVRDIIDKINKIEKYLG